MDVRGRQVTPWEADDARPGSRLAGTLRHHENIAGYLVKSSIGPQLARLAGLLLSYRTAVTLP